MNSFNEINTKSYLRDLILFVKNRIDIPDGDPEAIEKTLFNTLFQPFHLMVGENEYSLEKQVLEVPEYLEAAYHLLLNELGSSYAEMRLITEESFEHLAQRLGIKTEQLRSLLLTPVESDDQPEDLTPDVLTENRLAFVA